MYLLWVRKLDCIRLDHHLLLFGRSLLTAYVRVHLLLTYLVTCILVRIYCNIVLILLDLERIIKMLLIILLVMAAEGPLQV